jgi:hypothetical protein
VPGQRPRDSSESRWQRLIADCGCSFERDEHTRRSSERRAVCLTDVRPGLPGSGMWNSSDKHTTSEHLPECARTRLSGQERDPLEGREDRCTLPASVGGGRQELWPRSELESGRTVTAGRQRPQ